MQHLYLLTFTLLTFVGFAQRTPNEVQAGTFKRFEIGISSSPEICYRTLLNNDGSENSTSIINYRNENGAFKSRNDIKKVPRLGGKAYEQAAGFLRIRDAKNPLDNSSVHPETYKIVEKMAKDAEMYAEEDRKKKANQNITTYKLELN